MDHRARWGDVVARNGTNFPEPQRVKYRYLPLPCLTTAAYLCILREKARNQGPHNVIMTYVPLRVMQQKEGHEKGLGGVRGTNCHSRSQDPVVRE